MIGLRNSSNSKEVSKNENPIKVVNILEKILDFNKERKGRGLNILTPKVAGKTSENLLNEVRQIIYSLYWDKKLLEKYITMLMEYCSIF